MVSITMSTQQFTVEAWGCRWHIFELPLPIDDFFVGTIWSLAAGAVELRTEECHLRAMDIGQSAVRIESCSSKQGDDG